MVLRDVLLHLMVLDITYLVHGYNVLNFTDLLMMFCCIYCDNMLM